MFVALCLKDQLFLNTEPFAARNLIRLIYTEIHLLFWVTLSFA